MTSPKPFPTAESVGSKPATKPTTNDLLATERTVMANERTFLAYVRTSLTLVVPGLTLLGLADSIPLKIISSLFVPLGVALFLVGVARFRKEKKTIKAIRKDANPR